jgi:hypothetical protein
LSPDAAARTLFGLLKAPSAPDVASDEPQAETSEPVVSVASPVAHLTRDNVRRLQSALHELRECRRLIDLALKGEAA